MHLWLIGMMGSGKTTVGRLVAARAGIDFRDVDLIIQQRRGISIPNIWDREGEDGFRALESAAIEELARSAPAVISTGGGAVLRESNRNAMRRSGTVVWLEAPAAVLAKRVGGGTGRPLLGGRSREARLAELLEQRQAAYEAAAHHRVDTGASTPVEVAEAVEQLR